MAYGSKGADMHKETPKGEGEHCNVKTDKWPGARVRQSRLNSGTDMQMRGKRGSGKHKSLSIK